MKIPKHERNIDKLFDIILEENSPIMSDWIKIKNELKSLRVDGRSKTTISKRKKPITITFSDKLYEALWLKNRMEDVVHEGLIEAVVSLPLICRVIILLRHAYMFLTGVEVADLLIMNVDSVYHYERKAFSYLNHPARRKLYLKDPSYED